MSTTNPRGSVIAGVESCMDVQADVGLKDLGRLAKTTKSGLNSELSAALKALSKNEDGELAADNGNLDMLISEITKSGTKIEKKLGGNAALESSQLLALGAKVHFTGNIFSIQRKSLQDETFFKKAGFEFAEESGKNPVSLILQYRHNRFILCNGRGRRINDLKKYLSSLPETVAKLKEDERVSAISVPSWHVLFAGGISKSDVDFITNILNKIRKTGIQMFTDTGSFGNLSDEEIRLLWKIYGAFDVIGMNEFEFGKLCDVQGISGKSHAASLSGLLQNCGAHTIWLHTANHQTSISKKFSADELKNAEENSVAAGVLHIEDGGYPDERKISKRCKSGVHINIKPEKPDLAKGLNFSATASFVARKTEYEAGAGDISAATYFWSLID